MRGADGVKIAVLRKGRADSLLILAAAHAPRWWATWKNEMGIKYDKISYVVTAEVVGTEKSLLTKETEAIGAFLHAFVVSSDALDAGTKVKSALEEDEYTDIRIEEIVKSSNYIFEDDEEIDYDELEKEAIETNEVVYGQFYIYDIDDE